MTCAHEACSCPVKDGVTHCAPMCRMGIADDTEPCKCGHEACDATQGDASLAP